MRKFFYRLATDQINHPAATLIKAFLLFLSFIYGFCVRIILLCYRGNIFRRFSLPKPVISIGNLALGGVGKTPFVEFLAEFLKGENLKPVILIRGYMATPRQSRAFDTESDEANVLKESLNDVPVLAGRDRIKIGKEAAQKYPVDVFLLDDGFQHWRLHRDLDIVLIDATNPFGNRQLIPRGILREPLDSLRRADVLVLTKTDLGEENLKSLHKQLSLINPLCPIVETIHRPVLLVEMGQQKTVRDVSFLKGKSVFVLTGIGDPASFARSLRRLGAEIKKSFVFMDHHVYTRENIKAILEACDQKGCALLVTTQKDAVKLIKFKDQFQDRLAVHVLKMKIEIVKGKDEFLARIYRLCHR